MCHVWFSGIYHFVLRRVNFWIMGSVVVISLGSLRLDWTEGGNVLADKEWEDADWIIIIIIAGRYG